jgi:16S rRNA (adenine1518-N6/adenine1519-N6)-dimethyltransferase
MVFLVQREVAERVTSTAGTKEYGALSVNVQALAHTEIVRRVPPGAFKPPPKVDSAVIRITPRADPLINADEVDDFRRFVQALFGQRRKQIGGVLKSITRESPEILSELGFDPRLRSETLTPQQFVALFRSMGQRPVSGNR